MLFLFIFQKDIDESSWQTDDEVSTSDIEIPTESNGILFGKVSGSHSPNNDSSHFNSAFSSQVKPLPDSGYSPDQGIIPSSELLPALLPHLEGDLTVDPTNRVSSPFEYAPLSTSSLNILYQDDIDQAANSEVKANKPDSSQIDNTHFSNSLKSAGQTSIQPWSQSGVNANYNNTSSISKSPKSTFVNNATTLNNPILPDPSLKTDTFIDGDKHNSTRFLNQDPLTECRIQSNYNLSVFHELQPLTCEENPLIDSIQVGKVLRSNKITLLQRYLNDDNPFPLFVESGNNGHNHDTNLTNSNTLHAKDSFDNGYANLTQKGLDKSYHVDNQKCSPTECPSPKLNGFNIPTRDLKFHLPQTLQNPCKTIKKQEQTNMETEELNTLAANETANFHYSKPSCLSSHLSQDDLENDDEFESGNTSFESCFSSYSENDNFIFSMKSKQYNVDPRNLKPETNRKSFSFSASNSSCPNIPVLKPDMQSDSNSESLTSIIHIPLTVPDKVSISKALHSNYNNQSSSQKRSAEIPHSKFDTISYNGSAPIAIVSIASSSVPYPQSKIELLEKLLPHIATALVKAKVHTNLSNQLECVIANASGVTSQGGSYIHPLFTSPAFPDSNDSKSSLRADRFSPTTHTFNSMPSEYRVNGFSDSKETISNISINHSTKNEIDITHPAETNVPSVNGTVLQASSSPDPGNESSVDDHNESHTQFSKHTPLANTSHFVDKLKRVRPLKNPKHVFLKSISSRRRNSSLDLMNPISSSETVGKDSCLSSNKHESKSAHLHQDYFSHPRRPQRSFLMNNNLSRGVLSVKMMRKILESLPVEIYTIEPSSGKVSWASNRTTLYLGQTFKQFCNDPYANIHPLEKDQFVSSLYKSLRAGEAFSRMTYIRRFDDQYRTVMFRCYPLRDERGITAFWLCTLFDVHQQQKAEIRAIRKVRETASDHKYKILAETTPIIVFTFNPKKGIVYANKSWFEYSGKTPKETYGFEYVEQIHPDDRSKCLIDVETFKKKMVEAELNSDKDNRKSNDGIHSYQVEARLIDKSNQYQWHLITYTSVESSILSKRACELNYTTDNSEPHFNETGIWFGTCTNINYQKLNEEKLQEAKEEAQRTIESKTIFLSSMSHEIRTPLIGISGMISFLLDTPLSEEQLDYCHTISSSSDALLNVINDILDLSKVESGNMTLTPSLYHVRRLVEESNEFLSTLALSKSLELNYLIENDVPTWVKGDKVRLRQVMLNIISNAIKFTEKGEVFTRCSVVNEVLTEEEMKDPKKINTVLLKFEVTDTGRGFTAEDELKMFKPFSQIKYVPKDERIIEDEDDSDDNSSIDDINHVKKKSHHTTRRNPDSRSSLRPTVTPGTGLGLVISRQLIQLQGGTLTCKSKKDVGSIFEFTCRVKLPSADDKLSNGEINKSCQSNTKSQQTNGDPLDILIISPYEYAPQSIVHHVKGTAVNPELCSCTVVGDDSILKKYLTNGEHDSKPCWTHIIVNSRKDDLISTTQAALEVNERFGLDMVIVLLVSLVQKSTILENLPQKFHNYHNLKLLHKPLTLSKYSQVFDPKRQRESSKDLKMTNAQKVLEDQKDIYKSISLFVQKKANSLAKKRNSSTVHDNTTSNNTNYAVDSANNYEEVFQSTTANEEAAEMGSLENNTLCVPKVSSDANCVSSQLFGVNENGVRGSRSNTIGSFQSDETFDRFVLPNDETTARDATPSSVIEGNLQLNTSNTFKVTNGSSERHITKATKTNDYTDAVRILVAEDNPVNQKVLSRFFTKAGLSFEIVNDGVECTEQVFNHGQGYFDMIICDLDMPRKNGFEACNEIREWERKMRIKRAKKRERLNKEKSADETKLTLTCSTKLQNTNSNDRCDELTGIESDDVPPVAIVALSAYVMSDLVDQCNAAGFTRYISKPIDFAKLKDLILELLDD